MYEVMHEVMGRNIDHKIDVIVDLSRMSNLERLVLSPQSSPYQYCQQFYKKFGVGLQAQYFVMMAKAMHKHTAAADDLI